jgi:hypothetical protein
MKRYIIIIVIVLSANVAFCQDFFDALRYSQTNYDGSARSVAMGSAFGALGGDFISASINPAGLGFYRSGEFTFTPTLNINGCESDYLSSTISDSKYKFNFNNISYVGTAKTGAETGIVGFTFGIGFNRLKNFHSRINIVGNNAETSLLDYYTDYANSYDDPKSFDQLYEGLAWDTYLINKDKVNGGFNNVLSGAKPHDQKSTIERSGRIDEYLISMGFNVNHKFYFGASIGLLDLFYNDKTSFTEIDNQKLSEYFDDYTQTSDLSHSGVGINFKAGIVYRPIKSLRIGLAVHTPSFYTISYSENKHIVANYDTKIGNDEDEYYNQYEQTATAVPYEFKFESPLKAIISAAYLFGDKGLLSVDYEYSNYASSKLRPTPADYDKFSADYVEKTNVINNIFKATGNLRIGGEYRLTNNFSLRGGVQLLRNPWQKTYSTDNGTIDVANKNDSYRTYSAGFGYRQQNFFIDFAYRLSQIQEACQVHEVSSSTLSKVDNIATLNYLNNQATITFGFRF